MTAPEMIVVDGTHYPLISETLRTILHNAEINLRRCKKAEGAQFPEKDQQALNFITTLRLNHTNLI